MDRTAVVLTLLAATVFAAAGRAQDPYAPSPYGAQVEVRTSAVASVIGELIAVSDDSVWVLDDQQLHRLPLAAVRVRIRRFESQSGTAWGWGVLGGLGTAAGMFGACSSVEGTECGGVFAAMLVPWLAWGWVGASSLGSSSMAMIPHYPESLRPYARFPQGMPPGVGESTLRPRQ